MQHSQSVVSLEIPHLKKLYVHYSIHKNLQLTVILSHTDPVQTTLILVTFFPIQNYLHIYCLSSVPYVSFIATSPILSPW
jgi:hypothetical protein